MPGGEEEEESDGGGENGKEENKKRRDDVSVWLFSLENCNFTTSLQVTREGKHL